MPENDLPEKDMAENDDERLDRLKSSLSKARETQRPEAIARAGTHEAAKGDSGIGLAMRAGSEFISAIIVGSASAGRWTACSGPIRRS